MLTVAVARVSMTYGENPSGWVGSRSAFLGVPLAPGYVTDGRSSVVYYDRRDLMKDYSIVVHSLN